jgi:Spy/CpxP family protein refolding chaperone
MIFKCSSVFAQRGLLLAGILAAGCGVLSAQSEAPPTPPDGAMHQRGGPERQLEMLTRTLSLTDDQQVQVKALLTEQRQKMLELRRGSGGADAAPQGPPPDRQQMEAIRNDTDTKISALLNDDQKAKFAAWQAQRKARMERREGAGGPPPPPPGI